VNFIRYLGLDEIDTAEAQEGTVQATKYVQTHSEKNDDITCIGLAFNYHTKIIENWIGLTYNREGKRMEFFSKGDLIEEELIPDPDFSEASFFSLKDALSWLLTHGFIS